MVVKRDASAETVAKTDFKSVDEYIATHPEDVQAILQRVRRACVPAMSRPRMHSEIWVLWDGRLWDQSERAELIGAWPKG